MSNTVPDVKTPDDSPTFGKDGSFEVNKPVGSMSISPCGRDVVLASRHGLHIIDLDSPWSPPRHLAHHTPWEVADVQWSPFPAFDHWVVSTSNQKALVWNLKMPNRNDSIEHTLHGHDRAITDIQFSAHDPNSLATCAVDSFVHCWDLRIPRRPAYSFCDWFAGATQTKWNRINPHIIASSHDRTLHIWDNRKGAYALRSLDAHDTKIYGIDWNRTDPHRITTCSLDKSVKFWDYSAEEDKPERLLRTPFPVWRARHTPFGQGIMAMPQRGNFDLHMYDTREESIWDRDPDRAPRFVEKFSGHQDNVKEFLWRPRGNYEKDSDDREFQLVTWGADRYLRLHQMDNKLLQSVGFQRGQPGNFTTRINAPYRTFRVADSDISSIHPENSSSRGLEESTSLSARVAPMSSSPTEGALGWADAGFLNTQPGIRAKTTPRKDVDPIAWMKGVKIGKNNTDKPKQRSASTSMPTLSFDAWEHYENLGEEVKHVGQTFSRVEFGTVDINKRFLAMSLYGPWGKERAAVFISCRMHFPAKYPAEAAEFVLEESKTISPENIEDIQNTANVVVEEFAKRDKPSIEAVIRFLQRERSLDDLTGWLKQGLSTPNMVPMNLDEESSSDEEDGLGQLPDADIEDMRIAGSDVLTNSNANANVPLPKTCGAVWSRDGRLVCFFRPKAEQISSVAGILGLDKQLGSRSRKTRFFNGFGRINMPQAGAESRGSSPVTGDTDDSSQDSDSDDSFSLSTEDSSIDGSLSDRPFPVGQSLLRASLSAQAGLMKSHDDLLVQGSQTSKKLGTAYLESAKSVISIHNLSSLIPAKRELAAYQYQGANIGRANSELAASHQLPELADAWSMVTNLCEWDGPSVAHCPASAALEVKAPGNGWQPTTISLPDHSSNLQVTVALGLFEYFVARADIQMAAALACAFQAFVNVAEAQKVAKSRRSNAHIDQDTGVPRNSSTAQQVPVTLVEPEPQPSSLPSQPIALDSEELLLQPTSLASSLGADDTDRGYSFSTGNTPPSRRIPKARALRKESSFSNLKPSPTSRLWQLDSAAGGIIAGAGNFANAISQNFSFSASSSPPSKKWPSPTTSFTTARTHLTQKSRPTPGISATAPVERKWSLPEANVDRSPDRRAGELQQPKKRRFKITYLENSARRDKHFEPILTAEEQGSLCKAFDAERCAYADLLAAWGLPIARAEVLKHNTSQGIGRNVAEQPTELPPLELGKRGAEVVEKGPPPGLLARRLCPFCSATNWLDRRNAAFKCKTCERRVPPLACIFCNKLMRGRTYPCFSCGHVLHARCRTKLADSFGYDGRCIEGCDCSCSRAVVVPVPLPDADGPGSDSRHLRVGSAESRDTQLTEVKLDGNDGGGAEGTGSYESRAGLSHQPWEDMAKDSLARNLELAKGKGPRESSMRRMGSHEGRNASVSARERERERERDRDRSLSYRSQNATKRRDGGPMDTLDEY